jgi:hypothetical protein
MANIISALNHPVEDTPATELMTPYAAAKVVNKWIKDDGITRQLPPQMFYTYTRKNMIANVEVDGKRWVSEDDLRSWYNKYSAKNLKVDA